jgi:acetoin utilization deacetylase AcuC-like enzyme
MLVVYDAAHVQHNPTTELYDGIPTPMPELADRIEIIQRTLRRRRDVQWHAPNNYPDATALALHTPGYVRYLQAICGSMEQDECVPSNFIHDTYAPITKGTWQAARLAINIALTSAELLRSTKQAVYALCRPPGHHAGDAYMGGYCFFNNAAAAANELAKTGRVSVLDIDYHHGNGTQQLFYDRSDVQYVSIHANPEKQYPYTNGFVNETGVGAGEGYTHNFVVEKGCGWESYSLSLASALDVVRLYNPDYLVVSLGFDGYKDDPIAGFGLDTQHYADIAQQLRSLQLPTMLVQEGGYCIDALGGLADVFVDAFA